MLEQAVFTHRRIRKEHTSQGQTLHFFIKEIPKDSCLVSRKFDLFQISLNDDPFSKA